MPPAFCGSAFFSRRIHLNFRIQSGALHRFLARLSVSDDISRHPGVSSVASRSPLEFVSSGQINALIPYGTSINGFQDLLIAQNGVYSLAETLAVAAASPAVFTQSQTGQGAGVIVVAKADGTQFESSAAHPASAGDALVIYCSGLGAVKTRR